MNNEERRIKNTNQFFALHYSFIILIAMLVKIEESWRLRLQEEFDKPYFAQLVAFVKEEYRHHHVLPPGHLMFHVLRHLFLCPRRHAYPRLAGQYLPRNTR